MDQLSWRMAPASVFDFYEHRVLHFQSASEKTSKFLAESIDPSAPVSKVMLKWSTQGKKATQEQCSYNYR